MKRKFNKTLSLGFIISLLIGQIVAAESVNIHEPLATNQVETFISNQENMKTNKDSDYSLPTECMEKVGEEERTNIDKQALDEESDFSEEECEKSLKRKMMMGKNRIRI